MARHFGTYVLSDFIWKCVPPHLRLIVPKGCSTVCRHARITHTIRIPIEPRLHGLKEVLLAEASFSIVVRGDRLRRIDCDAGFLASQNFLSVIAATIGNNLDGLRTNRCARPVRSCEIAMRTSANKRNEIHYLPATVLLTSMLLTLPNG
jgi:hypothetical protein